MVVMTDGPKPARTHQPSKASSAKAHRGVEEGSVRSKMQTHLQKTKFCIYQMQGACRFGSQCSFAHNLNEMCQSPDLRKTQLCKAYERGECTDKDCVFAHGDDELRSTSMFYKVSKCIWYQQGKCRNGDKCRFAHGTKDVRERAPADKADIAERSKPKGRQGTTEKAYLSYVDSISDDQSWWESDGNCGGRWGSQWSNNSWSWQPQPGQIVLVPAAPWPVQNAVQPATQEPPRQLAVAEANVPAGENASLKADIARLTAIVAALTARCEKASEENLLLPNSSALLSNPQHSNSQDKDLHAEIACLSETVASLTARCDHVQQRISGGG